MKVFISWSTEESHRIALALDEFLKATIPGIEPWISSEDIEPGARWNHVLSSELEASSFGIVCLVRENLDSPWVHFEAGAIAKSVSDGRLIPLVRGISLEDIPGPLFQFQALQCDESGITRLVCILNDRTLEPQSEEALMKAFRAAWPKFSEIITGSLDDTNDQTESDVRIADLNIRMGYLGKWKSEQIIIENSGDGVAEDIEIFADGTPVREASFVIGNQDFVTRLRPGEEFGIKIALSMGSPERTDITVKWREESGEERQFERLVTLL